MDDDPLAQLEAGPIFICGHIRSGTTWVLDVLAAHPQVADLFESLIFTGSGLGPLLGEMHWKPEEHQEMFGRPMGLGQLVGQEEVLDRVRQLSDRWLAKALEPQHRFIVEKTPADAAALTTLAQIYPDASVIHVLRDGRDVAISTAAARRTWQRHEDMPDAPRTGSRDLWRIGLEWDRKVRSLRSHALSMPLPFHEVLYEDMHAKPRETARALFTFCGIPCEDALLDDIVDRTHFSKLPRTGPDQFRRVGKAGGWRNEWSHVERLLFTAAAGTALEQTGYAGAPPRRARQLRDVLSRVERLKRLM